MNALKKYQRITVVFLLLIGIVNYLDRSALSIANTSIQRDMLISPSQMGILLSAFSVAYAFAQLPLGLIIDRLGSKIALGASLLAWSVAQSLCGLVNSFSGFMGLRVLLGIGVNVYFFLMFEVWFLVPLRSLQRLPMDNEPD